MCNVYVLLFFVSLPIMLTVSQDGTSSKCVLPSYPEHGSYLVSGEPNAVPGQAFDIVRVNVTCLPGYRVVGNSIVLCIDGIWPEKLPECVRSCRLDEHPSVKYRCVISGNSSEEGYRDCEQYELVGTVIKPECNAPNYYRSGVLSYMRCTDDGWDYVAVCRPECGTLTAKGTEQVAGGRPVERGELPWHAGIYTKTTTPYKQICGGSLVSTTVVMSAAHCFWNKQEEKLEPASRFAVAVGKLFRLWGDPQDKDTQQSDVSEIKIPDRFRGETAYFQDDLAVVVLATPIAYKTHVRPVCMDFNKIFDRRQLQPGKIGKVAGWGLTGPNGPPSTDLRVLDTPYVDIIQCIDNAPPDFKQFLTSDKICAGFKDGKAVCEGDSGGGLVFPAVDRGTERYYLRGVVSTAPASDDACNAFEYTSYTQITAHTKFIRENVALFQGEVPDKSASQLSNFCILPPYPKYGRYVIKGEPNANPGQTFPAVQLDVTCDPGYAVEPNVTLDCSEGWWSDDMPRCARLCKLDRDPNVQYRCLTNDKGDTRECNDEERHGTTMKPECKAPYFSRKELPLMTCTEGTWDNYPTCNPGCGKVPPKSEGRLPWHVTIYEIKADKTVPICGGSIINETTVVSASICFLNESLEWRPLGYLWVRAHRFLVGVGNTYPDYEDPRDTGVQYATLDTYKVGMWVNDDVKPGESKKVLIDTYAVLNLKDPIKFTEKVSPVCLDFDENFDRQQIQQGAVGKVAIETMCNTQTINMSLLGNDTCSLTLNPEDVDLTSDRNRLCAKGNVERFCNSYVPCSITRGTGFAVPDVERDGGERYYLRGVLPAECVIFSSTTIENVGFSHVVNL